ncbi:MAG TPA: HAD family hydrolase, partial [Acidimicrobiales bacterium]|nr:HAD family hydrolase [Acidimicrobiales bacterium]
MGAGRGRHDLVIFDCDGVLVDSERLAVRTEAQILASLGWPLAEDEIVERFVGRSAAFMQGEIERAIGRRIDWESEFESRYRDVFTRELRPVDGVAEALERIDAPTCVASSGTHAKIRFSLGLTGLLDRFEGRIFSAEDVDNEKPAPDLFLYAARRMGHPPGRCAVVEDSVSGVRAGLAAGMSVFAFAGGVTAGPRLALGGAWVFETMGEL